MLKQAEAGTPAPELCLEHGIGSAAFYKWRSKLCGMEASLMSQLKELYDENRRLKKMYAEAQAQCRPAKGGDAKKIIHCDNRPEYISSALLAWAERNGIRIEYIHLHRTLQPNRPLRLAGPSPVRHN